MLKCIAAKGDHAGRRKLMRLALLFVLVCSLAQGAVIGYWPLENNADDLSGFNRRPDNYEVSFTTPVPDGTSAAYFNGKNAWLELSTEEMADLSQEAFSLSMEVYITDALDDALGDLVSQFDPETRRGFTLGIADYTGVSNSSPNHHNLFWAMDSETEPVWEFCGRPGNAILIFGFAVHQGALYAGTCEPGADQSGHVYRYEGGTKWKDCGAPDPSNAIMGIAVHDGKLYAGAGWYDTTGSSLEASANETPGGKIYCYQGGQQWEYCGQLSNDETGEAGTIGGLVSYQGALHATTLKKDGFGLYRYEGGTAWRYLGNPGQRVLSPSVFNGNLYMVSYDAPGGPFMFDGKNWTYRGASLNPPIHQDYSFAVFGGNLHLSTWPEAYVYRLEDEAWINAGRPGEELETMGMMVYNGKLYTGTLPTSCVYRYEGKDQWTAVSGQLDTAEGRYRRTWSMALYDGKLFCGTLPSGNVYALSTGNSISWDKALKPGWRHVAATRQGAELKLYVDGECVSARGDNKGEALKLSNDVPLLIGFGPGDYFNGWMRQLRLHSTCLTAEEVEGLYRGERGKE